jgi:hypothetical protein
MEPHEKSLGLCDPCYMSSTPAQMLNDGCPYDTGELPRDFQTSKITDHLQLVDNGAVFCFNRLKFQWAQLTAPNGGKVNEVSNLWH